MDEAELEEAMRWAVQIGDAMGASLELTCILAKMSMKIGAPKSAIVAAMNVFLKDLGIKTVVSEDPNCS